ncbi:protein NO VEIN domain-containing protein [Granulicella sibirica]|uniref:protein NO VEIN domain-containing protein n=1 Tax=Granulicella sibirica TaxID=2479048 RepID=UPI001008A4F4|nr:DUF3883 domain-containing protein [Granulicella sibirica]
MLPNQGVCIAVFLLGRSATLKGRRNIEEWIEGARAASSFMAASLNLLRPAEAMVANGLATVKDAVLIVEKLKPLLETADRASLFGIARLVMLASPPLWLRLAVGQEVKREYIPSWDLDELSWLDPDLDALLFEVASTVKDGEQGELRKQLGNAAELLMLDSLTRAGHDPLHVAAISDAFGYDIEARNIRVDRVEVKASSENTRSRFSLTRNEYEKSLLYGSQWRLVQIVFLNRAFVQKRFDAENVLGAYQLKDGALQRVIPSDTESFRWTESAELQFTLEDWFEIKL